MGRTESQEGLDNSYLKEVAELIRGMKYGSITIVVQDGKVVQIDRTEKYRVKN